MSEPIQLTHTGTTTFVATERTPQPLCLRLTCPEGLAAGTDLRVEMSNFHAYTTDWQLDDVRVEGGEGRLVVGHELPQDWTERIRGGVGPAGGGLMGRPANAVHLLLFQITQSLAPGASVVVALRVNSSLHAGVAGALLVRRRLPSAEAFTPVGEPIPLENRAGLPTRLEARAKTVAQPRPAQSAESADELPRQLVLFATDDLLNPVADYQGTLRVRVRTADDLMEEERADEVVVGQADRGRVALPLPSADANHATASPAVMRVVVEDNASDISTISNPILSTPLGERNHFFGAIHFHTRLSVDGDRDPRAAYAYARDWLNLDVVAMTDHAPIGPGWEEALAVNEAYYAPGSFVTLPAWESSNAYGHANLYLRTPQSKAGPWYWNPAVNPSEVAWPEDVVMVPHHPNTGQLIARGEHKAAWRAGRYWAKYDWSIPNPRARLVEIVQGRSNFEADALDAEWGIRMGEQGASVRDALAQGWRLGFVAGTDNHEGHPTQRNGRYVGLTCFRATELTREAIWQAMDQRQTYATSGVPIICDFAVNGLPSGTEGGLEPGDDVVFSARLHGTAPIAEVEIVADGQTIWQQQPNRWDLELRDVALPAPAREGGYYYLRLRQVDGHRAWLSPVWLMTGNS